MAASRFNIEHALLRKALGDPTHPGPGRELFLRVHACVHTREVSGANAPTYADDILAGMSETAWRGIPPGCEHSVAWIVWHMSRIEDAAMNIVLANREQVFTEGGWQRKLGI